MTSFVDRLLGRPEKATKASTGGPWLAAYQSGGINISSLSMEPQDKAAKLLAAYKVGWFNKAERKISTDFANLKVSVMPEDDSGDNEAEVIEPDLFKPWDQLDPVGRFLRLMERPNPYQTGRQLRQKTMIRTDMAGWCFWWTALGSDGLIQEDGIYGISPTRLWPSYNAKGNLIGWVMDRNSPSGGTPFSAEEIVPFTYSSADDDVYGVGVVESVYEQIPLSGAAARHTADLLSTGGRMAGMMWPKDRALDETEFTDAQRAWRNVTSDSNAAKRLLLFPEPMEWTNGASTPAEIGIPELATLNRDEILTAFPISPYILGVPSPGGLNSGETRREDRTDYWLNTIHPRVELFEEAVQTHIMSRYEKVVGYTLDFEVEEPNLDDAEAILAKTDALQKLWEAGFDDKEAVAAVGLEHIKWNGKPKPPPVLAPFDQPPPPDAPVAPPEAPKPPKPAAKSAVERQKEALDGPTQRANRLLTDFFAGQQKRTEDALRSSYATVKSTERKAWGAKADPEWWNQASEDALLTDTMRSIYVEVGREGLQTVANTMDRIVGNRFIRNVVDDLMTYGGNRIADINARTLQALTVELAEGTRRGYSINQLIEGVADEGFKGISGLTLDNGTPVFGDLRAETIARTETALSYNRSTVTAYGEFGVSTLLAYDGDEDDECAARDGQEFSIDEAQGIEDHPNGTLVWSPVVDKAVHEAPVGVPIDFAMKAIELAARTGEMPDIHNHIEAGKAPDVHMDAPVVHNHVAPAEVTVTPPSVEVTPIINVAAAEAPIVNVAAAEPAVVNVAPAAVSIEPTVVNVAPPEVHVAAPNVTVADTAAIVKAIKATDPVVNVTVSPEMRITSMPDRVTKREVKRNKQGLITETTDVEVDG